MKKLLSRTIKIGIVLNLPPLFLKLMLLAKLDIFPFIFSALLWANIPLQYLHWLVIFLKPAHLGRVWCQPSIADCLVGYCIVLVDRSGAY